MPPLFFRGGFYVINMSRIICENPRIITHPCVFSFLMKAKYLVYPDHTVTLRSVDLNEIYDSPIDYFNKHFPKPVNVQDVNGYYIVDENGEAYPCYMEVPCNECLLCRVRKMNSYKQQLEFELLSSEYYPNTDNFFVTLTYRNEFLPRFGLCKKHVQDYIKRIKMFISRSVGKQYAKDIKVFYSGEYGTKNTKRPHYHICFLHFPMKLLAEKYDGLAHAVGIFSYEWSSKYSNEKYFIPFSAYKTDIYGNRVGAVKDYYDKYVIGIVNVEPIDTSHVGTYVAKYVGKNNGIKEKSKVRRHYRRNPIYSSFDGKNSKYLIGRRVTTTYLRNPMFVSKSKNFGMRYLLDYIKPYFDRLPINQLENKFVYTNLSGKVCDNSSLCSYYIGKLFPTVSRLVPLDIRRKQMLCGSMLYDFSKYRYKPKNYDIEKFFNLSFIDTYKYTNCTSKASKFWHDEYCKKLKEFIGTSLKDRFSLMVSWLKDIYDYYTDYVVYELEQYKIRRGAFITNSLKNMAPIDLIVSRLHRQHLKIQESIVL